MSNETIRDVIIRVAIKQGDSDTLKLPELKTAVEDTVKTTKAQKELEKQTDTLQKSLGKQREMTIKAGDSLKQTGEGAFALARGIALLTSDTDEGFKKMLENIALVQGGFDLFKGSFEVVKGLAEGMKAITAAKEAATIAATAHAAALELETAATVQLSAASAGAAATTTAVAGASKGATLALGAMSLALNTITLALGLVAAGGYAVYYAWKNTFGKDTQGEVVKTRSEVELLRDSMQSLGAVSKTFEFKIGRSQADRDALNQLAALGQRGVEFGGGDVDIDRLIAGSQKLADLRRQSAESTAQHAFSLRQGMVEEERAVAGAQLKKDLAEAELQFNLSIQQQNDLRLQNEERINATLRAREQTVKGELDKTRQILDAEKGRLQSAEATFGRLSKIQQQRVKGIFAAGGPKTEKEAELIGQAGFRGQEESFFSQRGRAAGFGEIAGFNKELKTPEWFKQMQGRFESLGKELSTVTGEIGQSDRKILDILEDHTDMLQNVVRNREEIDGLKLRIDQLQLALKKNGK